MVFLVVEPKGKKSFIEMIMNFLERLGWKFRKISVGEELQEIRRRRYGKKSRRSRKGRRKSFKKIL